jgi:hypothetical protein
MGQAELDAESPPMGPILVVFELAIIATVLVSLALIVRLVRDGR